MRVTPMSRDALTAMLVTRILRLDDGWIRVAIDGAPAAVPSEWATALVAGLHETGRPALHVQAADFLRPTSLRYEFGRSNPDSFYEGWFDLSALRREVLDPLSPGGSGRVLPTFWDAGKDRNTRSGYQEMPPGAVLVLSGPLLLGAGLPFELEVHLEMSAPALVRRTPDSEAWATPAFARYASEVGPSDLADVVIRVNDLAHPALVIR